MNKFRLAATLLLSILAMASAPAFAGNFIGYDPDYILNPNGREVPQSSAPAAYAFGVDVWSVPGSSARHFTPMTRSELMIEEWKDEAFMAEEKGHAFGLRAFGYQADGG